MKENNTELQEVQSWEFSSEELITINEIQKKAKQFYSKIETALFERDELARLIVLAVLSKENIFLYGPPGTAKSNIASALKELTKGVWFRELMTDFTHFDTIFGKEVVQENGLTKRVLEGKLPTAEYAFLDEIFKANAEILNSLLTILNEREFDDGYNGTIQVPLRTALAASNEFPRSSYLKALFERFVFRIPVPNIKHKPNRKRLFNAEFEKLENLPVITKDEIDFVQKNYKKVKFSDDTANLLSDTIDVLFSLVNSEKQTDETVESLYEVSGRTMVKMGGILRLSAYLNKRKETDLSDLFLMRYIVWNNIHERNIILPKLNQELYAGEAEMHGDTIKELEVFSIPTLRYLRNFRTKFNGNELCSNENSFNELRFEVSSFLNQYRKVLNGLVPVRDKLEDCRKKEKIIKNNIFLFYPKVLDWKADESLIKINSDKFNELCELISDYTELKVEDKYYLAKTIKYTFLIHGNICKEIENWLGKNRDFFEYKLNYMDNN